MSKKEQDKKSVQYTALVDYIMEDGSMRKYYIDDSGLYEDPDEYHEHYYKRDVDLVEIFGVPD